MEMAEAGSKHLGFGSLAVTAAGAVPLPWRPVCWECCFFLWEGVTAATGSPAWPLSPLAGSAAATAATEDAIVMGVDGPQAVRSL